MEDKFAQDGLRKGSPQRKSQSGMIDGRLKRFTSEEITHLFSNRITEIPLHTDYE